MFNDRDRKFLLWAMPIIMIGGLLLNLLSGTSTSGVTDGLKYANTSDEQKALTKKLMAERKDAVIDPASGYVVCGDRRKYVLAEPLVEIKMCGATITGKKSYIEALQRANEYCMQKKNVCIIVYGSARSNAHSLKAATKRKNAGFVGRIFQSAAAKVECKSSHNMAQAFDVVNFARAHECLAREGFNGGWAGIIKDPNHYSKPEHGGVPRLSGGAAVRRAAVNKAWCFTKRWCRSNL